MTKIKIRERSWVARLAAYKLKGCAAAIVFGNTIHLWNVSREAFLKNERWVLHELAHVRQYQRYGFFPFLFAYLRESLRRGYYNNRFEQEARTAERESPQRDDVVFI